MLEILVRERGIYYMILGIVLIGIVLEGCRGRAVHRLLKAIEQPDKTDHPFVKMIRLRYKSYCRLQRVVYNPDAFIENQLYHYAKQSDRFLGMQGVINRCMLCCILAGGAGMSLAYRYKMGVYVQASYMLAALMAVVALELAEQMAGCTRAYRHLYHALGDYMENVLANQMEGSSALRNAVVMDEVDRKDRQDAKSSKVGDPENAALSGSMQMAASKEKEHGKIKESASAGVQGDGKGKQKMQEKILAEVIREFFP